MCLAWLSSRTLSYSHTRQGCRIRVQLEPVQRDFCGLCDCDFAKKFWDGRCIHADRGFNGCRRYGYCDHGTEQFWSVARDSFPLSLVLDTMLHEQIVPLNSAPMH